MRIALAVIAAVLLLIAGLWLIPRDAVVPGQVPEADLPWRVTPLEDGTSRVLGLHLGDATLADAIARFGDVESISLFINAEGGRSLEAYFGKLRLGPWDARVITRLDAEDDLLDHLAANSVGRTATRSGDTRLLPKDDDKAALLGQRLSGITYIPAYGNLEADFFRERLGEPAAWRQESENAVSWFYPELGLSLLIDAKGKEAMEYAPPRDFTIPPDAVTD